MPEPSDFGWGALAGVVLAGLFTYWSMLAIDNRQQKNATYYWLLGSTRSLSMLQHANLQALAYSYLYARLGQVHQRSRQAPSLTEKETDYLTLWEQRYFDNAAASIARSDELLVEIAHMNHELLGHIGRARRLFALDYRFDEAAKAVQEVVRGQLDISDQAQAMIQAETNPSELVRKLTKVGEIVGTVVDEKVEAPLRRLTELLAPSVPAGWARDFS